MQGGDGESRVVSLVGSWPYNPATFWRLVGEVTRASCCGTLQLVNLTQCAFAHWYPRMISSTKVHIKSLIRIWTRTRMAHTFLALAPSIRTCQTPTSRSYEMRNVIGEDAPNQAVDVFPPCSTYLQLPYVCRGARPPLRDTPSTKFRISNWRHARRLCRIDPGKLRLE